MDKKKSLKFKIEKNNKKRKNRIYLRYYHYSSDYLFNYQIGEN